MTVAAPFLICLVPPVAVSFCMVLLIEEFKMRHAVFAAVAGLAAVVPIAAVQFLLECAGLISLHSLFSVLIKSLLINGAAEETVKMSFFFFLPYKKMRLKVFFACAVLSGLFLGCFETVLYIVAGTEHFELRLLTAVVIHASCAGLSGLFVYSVRNGRTKTYPFILAIVLHGVYNYFAGFKTGSFFFWFSIAVVFISVIECRLRYRSMNPEGLLLFK